MSLFLARPSIFLIYLPGWRRFWIDFFPHITYDRKKYASYPKIVPHAFIYTMNDTVELMKTHGRDGFIAGVSRYPDRVLGSELKILYGNHIAQFVNYGRYLSSAFNEAEKMAYKKQIFPENCAKDRKLGRELAFEAIR